MSDDALSEPFPGRADLKRPAEDLLAIREALDERAAGDRGKSFEEFDREFRKVNGIPDR